MAPLNISDEDTLSIIQRVTSRKRNQQLKEKRRIARQRVLHLELQIQEKKISITGGLYLKLIREKSNLTQEELAQELKIPVDTIIRWEESTSIPLYYSSKIKTICLERIYNQKEG